MRGYSISKVALVLGVATFVLCMALAADAYPGGTWYAPQAPSHRFWSNFWCDLLNPTAISGRNNAAGSVYARMAFVGFAAALMAFWTRVRARVPGSRALPLAVALGWLSAVTVVWVSVAPSVSAPEAHALTVSAAGGLGVVAAAIAMPSLHSASSSLARFSGGAALLASGINLLQFLREAFLGAQEVIWLAGIQKIATLLILAWMLSAGLPEGRRPASPASLRSKG